jgi:hypothetical protein
MIKFLSDDNTKTKLKIENIEITVGARKWVKEVSEKVRKLGET